MKRQKDRTRKGYYYAPVPLEIIEVLDNLANHEGLRYGIDGRAEMVRNVLGTFVQLYEKRGPGSLNDVKQMILDMKKEDNDKEKKNSDTPPNNSPLCCQRPSRNK